MKLFAVLTASVVGLGASVLAMSPASAHTPAISADCNGVRVGATAYDPNMANRWSVTIGGVTQTGTFGASLNQTFPVPQNGATTPWSAYVEAADGSYRGQQSGNVGPCGTPTPPPPVDVCVDLPGDQPEGTPCTPPPDVTRADSKTLEECAVTFGGTTYGPGKLTYDEQYTDTYVFDQPTNTWVLVPDTTATVANLVFTPWTTQEQVAADCVDMPTQPPAAQDLETSSEVDCDSDSIVTTTVVTTTPFVYDDATNSWVPGQPHSETTTSESPVQPGDCKEQGVSPNEFEIPVAVDDTPASIETVPTAIAAGAAGASSSATVSAAATTPAASVTAAQEAPDRTPAMLLLLAGAGLVAAAALRIRRS